MLTHISSVLRPCFTSFQEYTKRSSLTPQQQQIMAIALVIFAGLALLYLFASSSLKKSEVSEQENIQSPDVIYFYNKGERYYELTNFFENWRKDGLHPVLYQEQSWKTSEHAFQAEKFNWSSLEAQGIRQQIIDAPTASAAFKIAQDYKHLARSDWHRIKDEVMLNILRCKFSDDHLSNVLRKTGSQKLVEASPVDAYWGYGSDGQGLNRLGILLMQVRKERFGL